MPNTQLVTAIDIGTDKTVSLIATIDEETRQLQVVGVSAVPSRGIRKSAIVDLEQTLQALTESLDAAERMAGFQVKSAYVSISGSQITSLNSKGVVAVAAPNQEISREDVSRVIEAARAVSLPNDRSVIHVIPRDFKVDTQTGIKDPIGMTGIRLEAEAHIVTCMTTTMRNLEKCLHDVGLSIDGFVFAGLASSEITTTETERELGVVVVDIGAGSTTICAFVEGTVELSAALPIGARHITQDIALGCRVSLDAAEKIKIALSDETFQPPIPRSGESKDELNKRRKKADVITADKLNIAEDIGTLSRKTLVEGIMYPRMKEIFSLVGEELQKNELFKAVPAGVIITGGGALTIGIADVAKRTLRLPARVGTPNDVKGITSDIRKPSFSASIGLIEYGRRLGPKSMPSEKFDITAILKQIPMKSLLRKISKIPQSFLP
jgi:cell division protein FtsA